MTETGWARAEQLASGDELSPADIADGTDGMANWWARHDEDFELADDVDEPWQDPGWVAGKGWGGATGRDWAFRMDERISDLRGNATRYSESDRVQTPQGLGVVTDVRTEPFEGKDGQVDASGSSPTYVVGLKDARVGVGFYSASQLSETEFPDPDVDPLETLDQSANTALGRLATALGLTANDWTMPETWREADTPARVILLDAWASMGGTATAAKRHLGSWELAAAMKDRVLGGWTGWRDGGD
jgi:hypothetical protein